MDLRKLIRESNDLPREVVDVPEWPVPAGSLYAKTLTPAEYWALQDEWRRGVPEGEEVPDIKVRICTVIFGTVGADGKQVFSPEDYAWLSAEKSIVAIARLFTVIARLNGMTKQGDEDLKKNSAATPGSAGSAGSPTEGLSASRNCSAATASAS